MAAGGIAVDHNFAVEGPEDPEDPEVVDNIGLVDRNSVAVVEDILVAAVVRIL